MIDCRLLMIGSHASSDSNASSENAFTLLRSNCYFDWMSLTSVSLEHEYNDHNKVNIEHYLQAWNKLYAQKRKSNPSSCHIQQSFMLMADVDNGDEVLQFEEAPLLFVSLISLSLSSARQEKQNNDEDPYVSIKGILEEKQINGACLYHCLDHCNYVLVCDGGKTSLKNYLALLRRIKSLKGNVAVHDITTLYGYDFEKLKEVSSQESIRLILSMNKTDEASLTLPERTIDEKKLREKWGDVFNSIGRYDQMLVSGPITWSEFALIGEVLCHNQTKMLASRIHVCLDEDKEETLATLFANDASNNFKTEKENKLICKLETTFNQHREEINKKIDSFDSQTGMQVDYALREVYCSICTMLKRAFSNYFVLCFFESFCQLLEYINKKLLPFDPLKASENEKDYYLERIYDLINSYFIYLRTLMASTLHSERRFVQADPHQLTYFDIPPKLIAFYTAFARKMTEALSGYSTNSNRYTFLIVPDFKKDIYVESLTENRDTNEELNILIIHINEKSMYDVSQTTKILAHEIAHHTGLGCEIRRVRAEAYMKCILAGMISKNAEVGFFMTADDKDRQRLFDLIVESFYQQIEKDIDINMETKSHDPQYVYSSNIPIYYYSDVFIREYRKSLLEKFDDSAFWDGILDKLFMREDMPWKHFDKYLEHQKKNKAPPELLKKLADIYRSRPGKETTAFLKKYAVRQFLNNLRLNITCGDEDKPMNEGFFTDPAETILYTFKEGMADIQMLCLISAEHVAVKDIEEKYKSMFKALNGRYESDEGINELRKNAVIESFLNARKERYAPSSEEVLCCTLFINYLHEQLVRYFKSATPMKNYFEDKQMNNPVKYEQIMESFLKTPPCVNDMIEIINVTINKYQEDLEK